MNSIQPKSNNTFKISPHIYTHILLYNFILDVINTFLVIDLTVSISANDIELDNEYAFLDRS